MEVRHVQQPRSLVSQEPYLKTIGRGIESKGLDSRFVVLGDHNEPGVEEIVMADGVTGGANSVGDVNGISERIMPNVGNQTSGIQLNINKANLNVVHKVLLDLRLLN